MKISGNTILISGGSAGIGLELARALLAAGNVVIVCGRDEARLERARAQLPGLHAIRCDVSCDDDVAALLARLHSEFPQLNMLINNAAMMRVCDFVDGQDAERIEREVRTNLLAPLKLTSLLLPTLQRQPAAAIVMVSSGLAYVPVANVAVYCATKAALHSFSCALRHRLRRTPVKVFELLPPLTDTELARTLAMPKIPPEQVARALVRGIARDRYEVRVGMVKPLHLISRLAPQLAQRMLNKAFSS